MVSDIDRIIDALDLSWRPTIDHQTRPVRLASDGSWLSQDDRYMYFFAYEIFICRISCCYTAFFIDATRAPLAFHLYDKHGDDDAKSPEPYGFRDAITYSSQSLGMVYSWVSRVLHELKREAKVDEGESILF